MKKILSFLSSISLISVGFINVVSCSYPNDNKIFLKENDGIKLENLFDDISGNKKYDKYEMSIDNDSFEGGRNYFKKIINDNFGKDYIDPFLSSMTFYIAIGEDDDFGHADVLKAKKDVFSVASNIEIKNGILQNFDSKSGDEIINKQNNSSLKESFSGFIEYVDTKNEKQPFSGETLKLI